MLEMLYSDPISHLVVVVVDVEVVVVVVVVVDVLENEYGLFLFYQSSDGS